MPKIKADLRIGTRAVEELQKKFPDLTEKTISERLGVNRKNFWFWKQGQTPSGLALQKMAFAGCDVKYILTGIRSAK